MKEFPMSRKAHVLCLLSLIICSAVVTLSQPNPQRHFKFKYAFTVRNPESGKPLKVWFPMATSDAYQQVKLLSVKGDLPVKKTKEAEYGNQIFYAEAPAAKAGEYHFQAEYDVVRSERTGLANGKPVGGGAKLTRAALNRFVMPDKLVPTTGLPAELAAKETQGASTDLQKARAIYDYVFKTMKYDKTGTGWGRGDTMWACDNKRGNCTDFHSLFASMARSQKIPTRFEIGFPLPTAKNQGEIPGYHCWSDFYADNTWVPIDISEAWKAPDKKDYFFGHHDVNRVQFSVGRDITLSPKQAGEALNYFVYPYVESDGKVHKDVRNEFAFEDVSATPSQTAQLN
jgi:transglutaminase-like putative cysteine protease